MNETCIHCGVVIDFRNGHWAHRINERSYLNRCQSPDVPYGHEAHPDEKCPKWCLGHFELFPCPHRAEVTS